MSEKMFADLVNKIETRGNFDHPDFQEIERVGKDEGFGQKESRQAFFVARDIKTLKESEKLDGGDGSETAKVDPNEVLEATFAKGDGDKI